MSRAGSFRNVITTMAIMLTLHAFAWTDGAAGRQPPDKDPLKDLPAAPLDIASARPKDRTAESSTRLATRAAKVLPPETVRSYARRLRLSDAQKVHLAGLYAAYRAGIDVLYEELGPRISELAVAGAAETMNYDAAYVALFSELRERELAYERELIRLEDRLFAGFLPVLAEEQWPLLDAVKFHRRRARCCTFDIEIYEAKIDLTQIVEDARLSDDTLNDLEPTLLEYERAITPLWLSIHEQADRDDVEQARLTSVQMHREDGSRMEPPLTDADRARGAAARAERERLNAKRLPDQDRLVEINRRFLPRVLELIPEPKRAHVHAEFLRYAHPRVYPDRHDPSELLDAAIATLPADAESLPLIRASWDTYRQTYDALTKEMIEGVRQWNRHMTLTNGHDPVPAKAVREARFKRWEASEKFVDQMLTLLPPESVTALEKQVGNFRQRLNNEREREKDPRMANP